MRSVAPSLAALAILASCAHAPGAKQAPEPSPSGASPEAASPSSPPLQPSPPSPSAQAAQARPAGTVPPAPARSEKAAPAGARGSPLSSSAGPKGPGEYFPLAIGNQWVYRDESPALPSSRRGVLRTVRILDRSADGFYRDNDRGELRVDGECVRDRVRRLLCQPFQVGTSWSSVVSVTSTERYEIAAVDEAVDTPAGRFSGCVRVRAHNRASASTDHVLEITYAPRVGPVRIETYVVVNGKATPQVLAELNSYRVEPR